MIEDNDEASEVILPENFSVSEDIGTTSVNFALNRASGKTISFNYETNSDASNQSYEFKSGIVTFAPGETSKTININIIDNILLH